MKKNNVYTVWYVFYKNFEYILNITIMQQNNVYTV